MDYNTQYNINMPCPDCTLVTWSDPETIVIKPKSCLNQVGLYLGYKLHIEGRKKNTKKKYIEFLTLTLYQIGAHNFIGILYKQAADMHHRCVLGMVSK